MDNANKAPEPQLFDFHAMPLTPAQETVVILKRISEQLAVVARIVENLTASPEPAPTIVVTREMASELATEERKAKIAALQARVPVAKRK